MRRRQAQPEPAKFSRWSTPAVPDSAWFASDFMLAASMAIIQPATGKVVVVHDAASNAWFLPRGRKDVGESLEQCALREAYEESGYRAEFLPLYVPSRAPLGSSPTSAEQDGLRTEPVYVQLLRWGPQPYRDGRVDPGGEYMAFYYVGQIPADAVRHENTGMADEQSYVGHLLDINDAVSKLRHPESDVLRVAHSLWTKTVQRQREEAGQQS